MLKKASSYTRLFIFALSILFVVCLSACSLSEIEYETGKGVSIPITSNQNPSSDGSSSNNGNSGNDGNSSNNNSSEDNGNSSNNSSDNNGDSSEETPSEKDNDFKPSGGSIKDNPLIG